MVAEAKQLLRSTDVKFSNGDYSGAYRDFKRQLKLYQELEVNELLW
jgi:hypothetical protein